MLEKNNLLILDEPTNHLDITSKEVLEEALEDYEGTIVFVSHDRYFINRIANKVFDIREDEYVTYLGNYDYYLEKREQELLAKTFLEPKEQNKEEKKVTNYELSKEEKRTLRKLQRTRDELMLKIEEVEQEISDINEQLIKEEVFTDVEKTTLYNDKLQEANKKLDELNDNWLEIEEQLESLEE